MYDDNLWSSIITATAYTVRSTYHTTLQATPSQLVFDRDMVSKKPLITDWGSIIRHKPQLMEIIIMKTNKNHTQHRYKLCEKVLVREKNAKKYDEPYKGSYPITQVCTT